MKTLQNNFTTPEQSKRLLELGVPADSADCYNIPNAGIIHKDASLLTICDIPLDIDNALPCWSVGRLIEIFYKCYNMSGQSFIYTQNMAEDTMKTFQDCKIDLDFSKLED